MEEIWKDIEGYEGKYQVSNLGRVRSLDRIITCQNRWGCLTERKFKGVKMSPGVDTKGYEIVVLCSCNPLWQEYIDLSLVLSLVDILKVSS